MRRQWPAHRVQPGLEPSIHPNGPLVACRVRHAGQTDRHLMGVPEDPRTQGAGHVPISAFVPPPRRCGEDLAKPPSSLARMVCPALFTVRLSQRMGRAIRPRLAPVFSKWTPSGVRCTGREHRWPKRASSALLGNSPEQGDGGWPTRPVSHDPSAAAGWPPSPRLFAKSQSERAWERSRLGVAARQQNWRRHPPHVAG